MKHLIGLFFGILICAIGIAQADPRLWGDEGIPIRKAHAISYYRSVASNELGQTLVLWTDARAGSRHVYAQLFDPDGSQLWPSGGIMVSNNPHRQENPVATASEDGWIIAWFDYRNDSLCGGEFDPPCGDLYAQKLDNFGNPIWTANDGTGVIVHDAVGWMWEPFDIFSDGVGGAIVVWGEIGEQFGQDVFGQHLSFDGNITWTEPLDLSGFAAQLIWYHAAPDGVGNLFIMYSHWLVGSNRALRVSKISALGEFLWGETGVAVRDTLESSSQMRVCSDGMSGCYVAWSDANVPWHHDLYAQHVDLNGQLLWPAEGEILCAADSEQSQLAISASFDGASPDGLLAVWTDQRVNNFIGEIYGQKLSLAGTPLWTEDGVRISGDATPQGGHERIIPRLASDRAGGLISVWEDQRNAGGNVYLRDVYASRLGPDGNELWEDDGVPVATAEASESYASVVFTGNSCVVPYFRQYDPNESLRLQVLDVANGDQILPDTGAVIVAGFSGSVSGVQTLSMSAGRTAIVWKDFRMGTHGTVMFYQIVGPFGDVERAVNGEMLAPNNSGHNQYNQSSAQLCGDGSGGFFVSFLDLRSSDQLIRLSHVNSEGSVVSADSGNVVWQDANTNDQVLSMIAPDGVGGCYVAWTGYTPQFAMDLWVMRMNAQLQRVWNTPLRLSDSGTDDLVCEVVPTQNGCIVVWQSGELFDYNVSAACVEADGDLAWSEEICSAPGDQEHVVAVSDGANGAYVVWADLRNDETLRGDIYALRISADGENLWDADDGIPVCTEADNQSKPLAVMDSRGDLIVTWPDFRNSVNVHLYGQKISPAGDLRWQAGGVSMASAGEVQSVGIAPSVDGDGFYAVWGGTIADDYPRIYASHFDSAGAVYGDPYWRPDSGGAVADLIDGLQSGPSAVSDGWGGCVVAWTSMKLEVYAEDIYAQRLFDYESDVEKPGDLLPRDHALYQNYPNPFNPTTSIAFDLPQASKVELKVFDLLGREVSTLVNQFVTAGHHGVSFDASRLPSGLYIYRLNAGNFQQSRKLVLLK